MEQWPGEEPTLTRLMQQAQAGDGPAYEALLVRIIPRLKAFILKRLRYKQTTEDVLQEVVLAIHKARHTYDSKRPFEPWMYAIAQYKVLDHRRQLSRLNHREVLENEVVENWVNPEWDAGELMGEKIRELLHQLPSKQKEAVTLLKLDGLSIKEAALKMGMTETALKVTAHRGYKALKSQLGVMDYGTDKLN